MTTATIKSDAEIQADVLNELKWDTTVNETEVGVQVKKGIVTLTGTISAYPKKLAAREAAHRVHGVLDVVDDMRVKVPTIWERTDQDLANAVRHALEWDVTVPHDRITTTVSHGNVTLEGTVDTWTQRYNAQRAVERLAGVEAVIDNITVVPKTADAVQIKQQIQAALERHAGREARRIAVSIHGGVLTLRGQVASWAQRNAIERLAIHAPGVHRVDDQTVVDPYI